MSSNRSPLEELFALARGRTIRARITCFLRPTDFCGVTSECVVQCIAGIMRPTGYSAHYRPVDSRPYVYPREPHGRRAKVNLALPTQLGIGVCGCADSRQLKPGVHGSGWSGGPHLWQRPVVGRAGGASEKQPAIRARRVTGRRVRICCFSLRSNHGNGTRSTLGQSAPVQRGRSRLSMPSRG